MNFKSCAFAVLIALSPLTPVTAQNPPTLPIDRMLPFFADSAGYLVLRANPDSTALSEPVLRDVLASILLFTVAQPEFSRETGNASSDLRMGPFDSLADYGEALVDFGGADETVAAAAEAAGFDDGASMPIYSTTEPQSTALRTLLRNAHRALTAAGYRVDEMARLVDPNGRPVTIDLAVQIGGLGGEQLGTLASTTRQHISQLGIALQADVIPVFEPEFDAWLEMEPATLQITFKRHLTAYTDLPEISDFLGRLPEDMTLHQQITALALYDRYMVDAGYAVPLAKTPANVDLTQREIRAAWWKRSEARRYMREACLTETSVELLAQSEDFFVFGEAGGPLVILLPAEGGSSFQLAIWAPEDQVGIPDAGVLTLKLPVDHDQFSTDFKERLPLDLDVSRSDGLLILTDPEPYLEVAEAFTREFIGELLPRVPTEDGPVSRTRLIAHQLSSQTIQCARVIASANDPLAFSPLATAE